MNCFYQFSTFVIEYSRHFYHQFFDLHIIIYIISFFELMILKYNGVEMVYLWL